MITDKRIISTLRAILVLLLLVVIVAIPICAYERAETLEQKNSPWHIGYQYEIIYIEGMPCLIYFGQSAAKGITCDWSKWEGEE